MQCHSLNSWDPDTGVAVEDDKERMMLTAAVALFLTMALLAALLPRGAAASRLHGHRCRLVRGN